MSFFLLFVAMSKYGFIVFLPVCLSLLLCLVCHLAAVMQISPSNGILLEYFLMLSHLSAFRNNCPVCREDMFSSRQSPQDLPCGHAIHAHCFRKLAGFDYRCPICKKTVVSQQSMAAA